MEAGESLKRCIQVISNIILTSLGGYGDGGSGLSDLGLKLRTWIMMLEVRLKKKDLIGKIQRIYSLIANRR